MGGLGLPELLIILFVLVFVVAGSVFWIWMLVECATKEADTGNNKIVWVLIIALTHWIGALLYLLVRRPQRYAELRR